MRATSQIERIERPSHIPNRPPKLHTKDMKCVCGMYFIRISGKLLCSIQNERSMPISG